MAVSSADVARENGWEEGTILANGEGEHFKITQITGNIVIGIRFDIQGMREDNYSDEEVLELSNPEFEWGKVTQVF